MAHDNPPSVRARSRSARTADSAGGLLAFANVLLATVQFAEPVLFGRIIDALAQAQGQGPSLSWPHLVPLVAAWVGFGLFMIVCSALVALYADRLAHRRRQVVLTEFFE
jgi:ATP-binding cassette, subfamily B, beta-glucan exporter